MIIVTGGAGFIGSNIVAALEKAGKKDLVVVDELGSSDKWRNIAKRELCAVVSPEGMLDYMKAHADEVEAVIHMGAISATTETDADLIIRTNFTLSWHLWEFCSLYGGLFTPPPRPRTGTVPWGLTMTPPWSTSTRCAP